MKATIEKQLCALGGLIPIGKTFIPVCEEELHRLEAHLGVVLPTDYREFVQKYGGAGFAELVECRFIQPEPIFRTTSSPGAAVRRYETAFVSAFYGGEEAGTYSLAKEIAVFAGRMPQTLIPIADDGGGHQICLGIRGAEKERVYYWDHHNEWDAQEYLEDYGEPMPPEATFQNVYLIAESFEDFLRRIQAASDD